PRPHVDARSISPAAIEPRVVPDFTWQRHSVEVPQMFTSSNVERARVARCAERDLAGCRAEDRNAPVDGWHAIPRHADVDDTVAAEVRDGIAVRGIERHETR